MLFSLYITIVTWFSLMYLNAFQTYVILTHALMERRAVFLVLAMCAHVLLAIPGKIVLVSYFIMQNMGIKRETQGSQSTELKT